VEEVNEGGDIEIVSSLLTTELNSFPQTDLIKTMIYTTTEI